jgi:hypothetical protein
VIEMTVSAPKVLGGVAILAAICFVVSGVFRNADHGVGLALGDVGWFGFLLLALTGAVLAVGILVRSAIGRRSH